MDELDEEVDRRVRELRGWMLKGTRPRRVIYLAAALHELVKSSDREFPAAIDVLEEFLRTHLGARIAAAIFDGEEVTDDPQYQRRRLAFGGGWEPLDVPGSDGEADSH